MVAPAFAAGFFVIAAFSAYRYFSRNKRRRTADDPVSSGRRPDASSDVANVSNTTYVDDVQYSRGTAVPKSYIELLVNALRQEYELSSVASEELGLDDYARLYRMCARDL